MLINLLSLIKSVSNCSINLIYINYNVKKEGIDIIEKSYAKFKAASFQAAPIFLNLDATVGFISNSPNPVNEEKHKDTK